MENKRERHKDSLDVPRRRRIRERDKDSLDALRWRRRKRDIKTVTMSREDGD